jgi:hypothetical protein
MVVTPQAVLGKGKEKTANRVIINDQITMIRRKWQMRQWRRP